MLVSSFEVEAACRKQFESAAANKRWLCAVDAHDYFFGDDRLSGLGVLSVLPKDDAITSVVLDIGAGVGTFLREAVAAKMQPIKPIGHAAIAGPTRSNDVIEWVEGDFQRPSTWQPEDVLQPELVDLAVSSLTFPHFADPLRGIENALHLLKPGGHLFIDRAIFRLDPANEDHTAQVIRAELEKNQGSYGFELTHVTGLHQLLLKGIHLQRKTTDVFSSLEVGVREERDIEVVYYSATKPDESKNSQAV